MKVAIGEAYFYFLKFILHRGCDFQYLRKSQRHLCQWATLSKVEPPAPLSSTLPSVCHLWQVKPLSYLRESIESLDRPDRLDQLERKHSALKCNLEKTKKTHMWLLISHYIIAVCCLRITTQLNLSD